MWNKASESEDGSEAQERPEDWKIGLVVPLWKKKGNKKDNNTYRGITLLSAGSNPLARAVATRLGSWSEGFIHESHCDFRKGRGVAALRSAERLWKK